MRLMTSGKPPAGSSLSSAPGSPALSLAESPGGGRRRAGAGSGGVLAIRGAVRFYLTYIFIH